MKQCVMISLLTGSLFIFSCKNTENNVLRDVPFESGKITEILIEKIPREVREYKLSELFSDFQTIPLETNPECMIGNTKIQFTKDYIFIGTQNFPGAAKLYRFDSKGFFVNEIGREGRGPGEHTGYLLSQLAPSDKDSTILVNWQGSTTDSPQIFYYNGKYKEDVVMPFEFLGDIYGWSNKEWFSTGTCAGKGEYSRDSIKLIFYNKDGNILKSIPRTKFPNSISDSFTPYGGWNSVYKFKDQWKLYLLGIDTVFRIADRNLVPSEVFIPGKNGMPYNTYISATDLPGKFDLKILAETEYNIIVQKHIIKSAEAVQFKPGKWSVRIVPEYQLIIIDKKSRKATYARITDDVFQFLPEELLQYRLEYQGNSRVFISLQAIDYLKMVKESKSIKNQTRQMTEAKEKLKSVSEESNPIILSFNLRGRIRIN